MLEIVDDKSKHCIPFLLERLRIHTEQHPSDTPPFFLGLNGVQGAGKTVLVSSSVVQCLACGCASEVPRHEQLRGPASSGPTTELYCAGLDITDYTSFRAILAIRGHTVAGRHLSDPR